MKFYSDKTTATECAIFVRHLTDADHLIMRSEAKSKDSCIVIPFPTRALCSHRMNPLRVEVQGSVLCQSRRIELQAPL